jgi:pyruvate formate lyase activating enzyme
MEKSLNNSIEELEKLTARGDLFINENGKVRCYACAHRCLLAEGKHGVCKVRFNFSGELRVPFGYVVGCYCDPIEKKPFYHFLPGTSALTFGMAGCNFHCPFCQNWITSQALKDKNSEVIFEKVTPEQLIRFAKKTGCKSIVSSYNEPLIAAEWAKTIFQLATTEGLKCAIVSNGYGTPEVISYLKPYLNAVKIDLKTFDDKKYRKLGGVLNHVTSTISTVFKENIWLEIVTLIIPGFNDDQTELREMARFIASLSKKIPWHLTAFHPDYLMLDNRRTRPSDLIRAVHMAMDEGLEFVYTGNLPGQTQDFENTQCPRCKTTLIKRLGFHTIKMNLSEEGTCQVCNEKIPGVWK